MKIFGLEVISMTTIGEIGGKNGSWSHTHVCFKPFAPFPYHLWPKFQPLPLPDFKYKDFKYLKPDNIGGIEFRNFRVNKNSR